MRSLAIAISLLAITSAAIADQIPSGQSQSGKIAWELRGEDGAKTVWLSSPTKPEWQPVMLCETEAWGNMELRVSPDDYWIAITDGGSSLGVHLKLFRREKGLVYKLQKEDVEGQLAYMALNLPSSAEYPFDHQYTRIVKWSENSKYVLFKTSGHGGNKYKIEEFMAVYDLGKKTMSRDLNKINAD